MTISETQVHIIASPHLCPSNIATTVLDVHVLELVTDATIWNVKFKFEHALVSSYCTAVAINFGLLVQNVYLQNSTCDIFSGQFEFVHMH